MPTTLNSGLQLPDKGSVDWYSSMQNNYNLLDDHLENTNIHVTAEDKANWDSKQGSLSQAQLDAIAQVATNTNDIATLQSDKADASHTHSSSDITDIGDYATKQYVDTSISGLVDNAPDALNTLNELSAALNDDSNFASTVTTALGAKANSADLATVATSGSYTDLTDKPTINDSTITIQKNGSTVDTFTTNGSDKTINITVPTETSDLNNDSGFITLNDVPTKTSDLTNDSDFVVSSSLAAVATSGFYNDLDNKPYIPDKISDLIDDSNFVDTSNPAVSSGITSAKVTDYDAHIADTDIHVTTADKQKWNNQTYVLRYSSTTLVASSTNSNSLLDNTDNLKVGDKVIDNTGNIYVVTAIDTANSTFTIGTSLIDLAQDSDVVHKSGNEDVNGTKTFKGMIPIDGDYLGNEASNNQRTNICLRANRDTAGKSCAYITRFRQNRSQGALQTGDLQMIGFDVLENEVRTSNVLSIQCTKWLNDVPQKVNIVSGALSYSYGNSARKALFNDLNPSSLSLPDLDNGIDISSYLTNAGTVTPSEYTPSVNGYICVQISADSPPFIRMYNDYGFDNAIYTERNETGSTSGGTYTRFASLIFPANKDVKVYINIMPSTFGIISAKFYPCQGNV